MRTWSFKGLPGPWATLLCAVALAVPALLPVPARAAEIHLSSRTYLLHYERDLSGGQTQTFTPLYEYLSADAGELGGHPVSFHFYGWGRQDLGDDTGSGNRTGELGSAYIEYRHPSGNGEMRAGRFFLAEGTAAEILDGAFMKVRTTPGLGVSVFGGVPVEQTITNTATGDSLYGGRIFFSRAGVAEVGVGYLVEKGTFQGKDREVVGGDLWLRPGIPVELTGRTAYNVSTSSISSQRYVLRILSFQRLDFAVGYDEYKYRDLFQTALNPAFLSPSIDNSDKVRTIFGIADITVAEGVTLEAGVKQIRHDLADPGDALRGDLGVRIAYNDRKDLAGLSAGFVSADRDENEYQEFRAFGSYSPAPFRFTLDALTHRYKQAPGGSTIKDAYQVVGSAGWQALPYLKLSADLTYTRSPQFTEDYSGLLRIALDLGMSTEAAPAKPKAEPPRPSVTVPAAPPAGPGSMPAPVAPKPSPPVPVLPPKAAEEKPALKEAAPVASATDPVIVYLDRMAGEFRAKFPGATVRRDEEIIEIRLPADLVFDSGAAEVKESARKSVAAAAAVLKQFPETLVTVEGHTDSTGDPAQNQVLSEKRARNVFDILVREGVDPLRISLRGYGDTVPVADNGTAEGRQANRRVGMKIRPDRNLKSRQGKGR